MLLSIFSIYDTGISTWLTPLFFRNKGEALRWWAEVSNNPESRISKHPSDFCLFEIGVWNDDNCAFDIFKAPVKLGLAVEFVKVVPVSAASKLEAVEGK